MPDTANGCSVAYYQSILSSCEELATMRRIDELHLSHPFASSRMLSPGCSNEKETQSAAVMLSTHDEMDGYPCALPQAQYQQVSFGTSGLSLSAAQFIDHPLKTMSELPTSLASRRNAASSICLP